MVSGRSDPSRCTCSSALGRRPISSRVSIRTPAGAHNNAKDGSPRERPSPIELETPAVSHECRSARDLSLQLWIEGAHRLSDVAAGRHIHRSGIDKDAYGVAHLVRHWSIEHVNDRVWAGVM